MNCIKCNIKRTRHMYFIDEYCYDCYKKTFCYFTDNLSQKELDIIFGKVIGIVINPKNS